MRFLIVLALASSLSVWAVVPDNDTCPGQLSDFVLEFSNFTIKDPSTAQLLRLILDSKNKRKSYARIAADLTVLKVPSPLGYQTWNEAAVESVVSQAVNEVIHNEDLEDFTTQTRVICGLSSLGFGPSYIANLFNRLEVPRSERIKWYSSTISKQISNHCEGSAANRDYFIQYPWRQPDSGWNPEKDLKSLSTILDRDVFHITLMKLKWHGLSYDEIIELLLKDEFSQLFTNVPLNRASLIQTFVMNQKRVVNNFLSFHFGSETLLKSAIIALDGASLSPMQISLLLLEKGYTFEDSGEWTDQRVATYLQTWLKYVKGIHRISPLLTETRFEAPPTNEFQAKINLVAGLVKGDNAEDWDLDNLPTVFEVYAFLRFNSLRDENSDKMATYRDLCASVRWSLVKKFERFMYKVLHDNHPEKAKYSAYKDATLEGLLIAIETYDYRRQFAWFDYCTEVILNEIFAFQGSKRNRQQLIERASGGTDMDSIPSENFSNRGNRSSKIDYSNLYEAIAKLPPDEKEIIKMRLEVPPKSCQAIADKMGKTPSQIRTLTTKAFEKLRELLGPDSDDD